MAGRVAVTMFLTMGLGVTVGHATTTNCDLQGRSVEEKGVLLAYKSYSYDYNSINKRSTTLYVRPRQDFEGVSLEATPRNSSTCAAWFPADQRYTSGSSGDKWIKLEVSASKENTGGQATKLSFTLNGVSCGRECTASFGAHWELSVVAHGSSTWRQWYPEPPQECIAHDFKSLLFPSTTTNCAASPGPSHTTGSPTKPPVATTTVPPAPPRRGKETPPTPTPDMSHTTGSPTKPPAATTAASTAPRRGKGTPPTPTLDTSHTTGSSAKPPAATTTAASSAPPRREKGAPPTPTPDTTHTTYAHTRRGEGATPTPSPDTSGSSSGVIIPGMLLGLAAVVVVVAAVLWMLRRRRSVAAGADARASHHSGPATQTGDSAPRQKSFPESSL